MSREVATLATHLAERSDPRTWAYKQAWMAEVRALANRYGYGLGGKNVLEIGAGVHNPLGSAVLSLASGALNADAIEPLAPSLGHLQNALQTLLIAMTCDSRVASFPRESITALVAAVCDQTDNGSSWAVPTPVLAREWQQLPQERKFHVFHSNAVLEHVSDLPALLAAASERAAPAALHVHKVDFTDPLYYRVANPTPADAFRYLTRDYVSDSPMVNGIRFDELIEIFKSSGHELIAVPERWHLPFPENLRPTLRGEYSACSDECLSTVGAVLVFSGKPKPAEPE
jgi:hypothetical protein